MGYHRAGFDIVGVDIAPQPHYPFEFVQGDALEVVECWDAHGGRCWEDVAAIHASPPCQHYSTVTPNRAAHPDLYGPTRDVLLTSGLPFVIENVIGAPYNHGVVLCGTMFGCEHDGEWLRRHRNFETSWLIMQPQHHRCGARYRDGRRPITVTGQAFLATTKDCARHSRQGTRALAETLMGIDWMTKPELVASIPPAYTEFIGRQLLDAIAVAATEPPVTT